MSMGTPDELIECPLCALPHERAATKCDECGQDLRSKPTPADLHAELKLRQRHMALAALAILTMIALNIAFFGGAGYLLSVVPIAWLGNSWLRSRVLRAHFERQPP